MATGVYQVTYHLDMDKDGSAKMVCTEKNVLTSPVKSAEELAVPPDLSSLMDFVRQEHERRLLLQASAPPTDVKAFMADHIPTLHSRIELLESELSAVRCKAAKIEEDNKALRAKIAELQACGHRKSKPPRPPPLPPKSDHERHHLNPLASLMTLLRSKKAFKTKPKEVNNGCQAAMKETIERLKKGQVTLRHVQLPEQVYADVPASPSPFAQELQAALGKLKARQEKEVPTGMDFRKLEKTAQEIVPETSSIPSLEKKQDNTGSELLPVLARTLPMVSILPPIEESSIESLDLNPSTDEQLPEMHSNSLATEEVLLKVDDEDEKTIEDFEFGTPSPVSLSPIPTLTPSPVMPDLYTCDSATHAESGFESDSSTLTADSLEGNLHRLGQRNQTVKKSNSIPKLNSQWLKFKTILAQVRHSSSLPRMAEKPSSYAYSLSEEDLCLSFKLNDDHAGVAEGEKKHVRFAQSSTDLVAAFL